VEVLEDFDVNNNSAPPVKITTIAQNLPVF
jgi:hypothetical protein